MNRRRVVSTTADEVRELNFRRRSECVHWPTVCNVVSRPEPRDRRAESTSRDREAAREPEDDVPQHPWIDLAEAR
jgi:hypothetical protein